ncbi:MAG: CRISPR-associated helicase Cas3' [Oscillospiraceae bacterium]|jgi:CRISPR-associated endonuclease/helicase Cas3|nr:CRISPR-associated helicase Cas3' [Oscillospiraceae bacterium]
MADMLAHIDHDTDRTQTLAEHSTNTARYAAYYAAALGLARTAYLIGLLHDIGKATEVFKRYLAENDETKRGKINHAACGARYISERFPPITGDDAALTSEIISAVIVSHHQGLIDIVSAHGDDAFRQKLNPERETYYAEAVRNAELDTEQIDALFADATAEVAALNGVFTALVARIKQKARADENYKFYGKTAKDFLRGLAVHFLLSCLLDADRYDTAQFTEGAAFELPPPNTELWGGLSDTLDAFLDGIEPTNRIDEARAAISRACRDATVSVNGVFQLSVPTGAGKTFAGMRFALHNAAKHGKSRIFYIAPYKTILEQNAAEIRDKLRCGDAILEHHSDVIVDEYEDGDGETVSAYKRHTERWDSPIILTTMVQFLNTLFLGKNRSARRFHNLANSVIIIDEAQSLPTEMTHMLTLTLNFLAYVCNATVLLCTATQPNFYNIAYPLLLADNAQLTPNIADIFAQFKRVDVIDNVTGNYPLDTDALTSFVTSLLPEHKHILTILNTKGAAGTVTAAVTEAVSEENPTVRVIYITTNLCPEQRHRIIEEIKAFPKDEPLICVATNLVEAGVDFSFDAVVRSLAGLDNAVQAAGRCNRNGDNPNGGKVYIVEYRDENISPLRSVKSARDSARALLYQFAQNPEKYESDLISPSAMDAYYAIHIGSNRKLLNFPVAKRKHAELFRDGTTLLDLLSCNAAAAHDAEKNRVPNYPLAQSFNLAGELFSVIDDDGEGIIVPYGDGVKYIEELRNPYLSSRQVYAITRKAQRYTVSVHKRVLAQLLKYRAVELLECGVYALEKRYYDEKFGLLTDEQKMETLLQ